MVEWWQVWITAEAVHSLGGNNDIVACAKFGKFYCVCMNQVVDDKEADELMLKNLGRTCFFLCPYVEFSSKHPLCHKPVSYKIEL